MKKRRHRLNVFYTALASMAVVMVIYKAIPYENRLVEDAAYIQEAPYVRNSENVEDDKMLDIRKEPEPDEEKEELSDIEIIHKARRTTLIEECRGMEFYYVGNNSENVVRNHFVYDVEHKFVYCAMEKIGSTFWRRLFQIMSGSSNALSPFRIPAGSALGGNQKTFSKVRFDEILSVLETSTKFVFTRDPYLRLLSGYVDKLFSPNPTFWKSVGTYAIRMFRKNATPLSLKCGHDLTFAEFVKYVIKSEETLQKRDGHFTPMYDHCKPCQIKFDIIGKMESFEEDTLYILDKLGFPELRERLSVDFRKQTNIDSFKDQTNHVINNGGTQCLSNYNKQRRMWRKTQIRGLISTSSRFPFSRKESNNVTKTDYYHALVRAVGDAKDPSVADHNRWEAVREAYSTIPMSDMQKLQRIFLPDCKIFSYECNIDDYKPKHNRIIKPFYFDISQA